MLARVKAILGQNHVVPGAEAHGSGGSCAGLGLVWDLEMKGFCFIVQSL